MIDDEKTEQKILDVINGKETKDDFFKVNPARTVEEVEEWCKRQLERKCNK